MAREVQAERDMDARLQLLVHLLLPVGPEPLQVDHLTPHPPDVMLEARPTKRSSANNDPTKRKLHPGETRGDTKLR
jgi:hypothetical protein